MAIQCPSQKAAACLVALCPAHRALHDTVFGCVQEEAEKHVVKLGRQLIGNLDEVTDLRLIGPPAGPTQLVLATNSPTIRMFDLTTMSCSATLSGHTDTVLVLDAIQTKGKAPFCPCDACRFVLLSQCLISFVLSGELHFEIEDLSCMQSLRPCWHLAPRTTVFGCGTRRANALQSDRAM